MPKGKVLEFTQEKGFGKMELEDGTVVTFDASVISSFDIGPGDVGEVEFRELRNGRRVIAKVDFGDE